MTDAPDLASTETESGGPSGPGGRRPLLLAALGVAVLLIAVLVAVAVTGGDDDEVSTGDAAETTDFWGTTWRIVTITEKGKDTTPDLPEGKDLLDATTEGRISFTGCNGGSGGAELEGDKLTVDAMMSTQMACVDGDGQVLMDHDAFMGAFLEAGPTVSIEGSTLTLTGTDATITLEAVESSGDGSTTTKPGGDPDEPVTSDAEGAFWGSTWTITSIVSDGAEVPVVDAQGTSKPPALDTTAEGSISFTGCNGGRGEANYAGGKLTVGPIMSTKMACDNADLMAQDQWLGSFLNSVPDVTVDGDTLTLTSGQDQVVATRQG